MWQHWSIPGSSWFLPIPSTEMNIEGTALFWCYWHQYECDGRAENAFIIGLPGMLQTPLQSLPEVYSSTRELFWEKYRLNDVLYFPEIMGFRIILKLLDIINSVYIVKARVNVFQYLAHISTQILVISSYCFTTLPSDRLSLDFPHVPQYLILTTSHFSRLHCHKSSTRIQGRWKEQSM
jgi:hypothetical protein